MPSGSARVVSTSIVCGKHESATKNCGAPAMPSIRRPCTRWSIAIASAAAVASSSSEALATCMPVRSRHHRLEREQRFEAALRDFRLVRRIRRVPAGILQDVAHDHARRDAVVVAEAEERPEDLVARRGLPQLAKELLLAQPSGRSSGVAQPDARGNRLVDQRVERRRADDLQHGVALVRVGSDMARLKCSKVDVRLQCERRTAIT